MDDISTVSLAIVIMSRSDAPGEMWSDIPVRCRWSGSSMRKESATPFRAVISAAGSPENVMSYRSPKYCLRSSSTFPLKMLRLLLMSVMLSHISSTEAMLWVEKITVAPLSRRPSISFLSRVAFMGSNPEKGSSNIRSLGRCRTVIMNWTFCAIPLESSSTRLSHQDRMPNFPNHSLSSLAASDRLRPFSRAKNIACSPTFIFLYRPRSSGR